LVTSVRGSCLLVLFRAVLVLAVGLVLNWSPLSADTGRVLVSEVITEDDRVRGELFVSYQSQPFLGLLVPIELRERYPVEALQAQPPPITGQATCSNFRRFEVSVDQKIGPIQ
jgi:hypothetical protein